MLNFTFCGLNMEGVHGVVVDVDGNGTGSHSLVEGLLGSRSVLLLVRVAFGHDVLSLGN